jgi:DNA-binding GntR family transcriptional regulator
LSALSAAVVHQDVKEYTTELDRFYELLMEIAGNDVLRRSYEALTGPVRRLRRIAMQYPGRVHASLEHAAAIVAAIESRDEDTAEREMRSQLSSAREAVLSVLTTQQGAS